jgi:uncharacterized protein YdhG (YjbR/CyaY superfamily)
MPSEQSPGDRGAAAKRTSQDEALRKIDEMSEIDKRMALRVHEIVTSVAPELSARTWYGMPAWALRGKVVCFFQAADKFGTRYATLGFTDSAQLDDGEMWPTSFALTEITPTVEERISELIARAVGLPGPGS